MNSYRKEFAAKLKLFLKAFVPVKYKSLNDLFADIGITKPMYDNWTRKLSPNIPGTVAWKKISVLNPSADLKDLWIKIKGYDLEEDLFIVKDKNEKYIKGLTLLSKKKQDIFLEAMQTLEDEDVEDICFLLKRKLDGKKNKQ